jgi:ketosteroid isomerase-like protein
MRVWVSFGLVLLIMIGFPKARQTAARSTQENPTQQDREAIERLHRQIIEATLSGQADQITALWDFDGVRLTSGGPPEIGKAMIDADNKADRAAHPAWKTIRYQPEVKDLQVSGDWAFEWGAFETAHQESATSTQVALHGQFLRVLKRQADGSWKIARLMLIESAK